MKIYLILAALAMLAGPMSVHQASALGIDITDYILNDDDDTGQTEPPATTVDTDTPTVTPTPTPAADLTKGLVNPKSRKEIRRIWESMPENKPSQQQ